MVRRTAARRRLGTAGFYALAGLFMLPTVFVFYWMITLSLKPQVEATAYPPSFFRFSVTTAGYREVFTKYPFLLYTWNSLVVEILFRAIDALKTFDVIYIMTQDGPANSTETINVLLFNQAFSYFNMGYASSMAVVLFAIVMGASLILIKVRRTAAW